jgi:hypothetical protein
MLTSCHHCGNAFEAQRASAVFCGGRCRLAEWRRPRRKKARIEYYSPPEIVDAARAMYGGVIDLDPASCRAANEVVKATDFFSIRDNGLAQRWHGRVWINPPFPWKPWVPKLLSEWRAGNVVSVIALSTTRVTTARYFAPLVESSTAVLKMQGRIRFWGPSAAASPDDGHELYYFGPDAMGFEQHFAPFGKTYISTTARSPAALPLRWGLAQPLRRVG